MSLFIFLSIKYIPEKLLNINEIFLITIVIIILFIILDIVSPSINVNIISQDCDN